MGLCRPRLHRLSAPSGAEGPPGGGSGGLPVPLELAHLWTWVGRSARGPAGCGPRLQGTRSTREDLKQKQQDTVQPQAVGDGRLPTLEPESRAKGREPRRIPLCLRPRAGANTGRPAPPWLCLQYLCSWRGRGRTQAPRVRVRTVPERSTGASFHLCSFLEKSCPAVQFS